MIKKTGGILLAAAAVSLISLQSHGMLRNFLKHIPTNKIPKIYFSCEKTPEEIVIRNYIDNLQKETKKIKLGILHKQIEQYTPLTEYEAEEHLENFMGKQENETLALIKTLKEDLDENFELSLEEQEDMIKKMTEENEQFYPYLCSFFEKAFKDEKEEDDFEG